MFYFSFYKIQYIRIINSLRGRLFVHFCVKDDHYQVDYPGAASQIRDIQTDPDTLLPVEDIHVQDKKMFTPVHEVYDVHESNLKNYRVSDALL